MDTAKISRDAEVLSLVLKYLPLFLLCYTERNGEIFPLIDLFVSTRHRLIVLRWRQFDQLLHKTEIYAAPCSQTKRTVSRIHPTVTHFSVCSSGSSLKTSLTVKLGWWCLGSFVHPSLKPWLDSMDLKICVVRSWGCWCICTDDDAIQIDTTISMSGLRVLQASQFSARHICIGLRLRIFVLLYF